MHDKIANKMAYMALRRDDQQELPLYPFDHAVRIDPYVHLTDVPIEPMQAFRHLRLPDNNNNSYYYLVSMCYTYNNKPFGISLSFFDWKYQIFIEW
jgi:hypothetical protein